MHDMGGRYQAHQSHEALLLGAGAGGDVDGVDPKVIAPETVDQVLGAYPRLQFKKRFTAAAMTIAAASRHRRSAGLRLSRMPTAVRSNRKSPPRLSPNEKPRRSDPAEFFL
jgi:hypothetical protein